MEEALPLIIYGCKLARTLETNLPHYANRQVFLSKSCVEIIEVFKNAVTSFERGNTRTEHSYSVSSVLEVDGDVQDWLRSSYMRAVDGLQIRYDDEGNKEALEAATSTRGLEVLELNEDNVKDSRSKQPEVVETMPVTQRSRKRKEGVKTSTLRVPAPVIGNTEIPPEDGYTWRKYGQKEILGSVFPRGYYRCTHKNFYGCNAKKQVQRLDDDPSIYEITYYGDHTCHVITSTTAAQRDPSPQLPQQWLMETSSHHGGLQDFSLFGGVGEDRGGSPDLDFAHAMFNLGSSSNNSLDTTFPSIHDN